MKVELVELVRPKLPPPLQVRLEHLQRLGHVVAAGAQEAAQGVPVCKQGPGRDLDIPRCRRQLMTNLCQLVRQGSARWQVLYASLPQGAPDCRQGRARGTGTVTLKPTAKELQVPVACKHEQLKGTWSLQRLLLRQLRVQQSALVLGHSKTGPVEVRWRVLT